MTVSCFEENLFQISRPTICRQADPLNVTKSLPTNDFFFKVHVISFDVH